MKKAAATDFPPAFRKDYWDVRIRGLNNTFCSVAFFSSACLFFMLLAIITDGLSEPAFFGLAATIISAAFVAYVHGERENAILQMAECCKRDAARIAAEKAEWSWH